MNSVFNPKSLKNKLSSPSASERLCIGAEFIVTLSVCPSWSSGLPWTLSSCLSASVPKLCPSSQNNSLHSLAYKCGSEFSYQASERSFECLQQPYLSACSLMHLFAQMCILLSVSILTSKYQTSLSCFLGSAQRGVILNPSPRQTRCDLETVKLENSRVPLCPPPPNPQVALQPQRGTGTVLRELKRPLEPQARQAHPLKLKLTRGALTTLVAGLVSSASRDWSRLPVDVFACLPTCMENVLV